jgi:hypothetical protein
MMTTAILVENKTSEFIIWNMSVIMNLESYKFKLYLNKNLHKHEFCTLFSVNILHMEY